MSPRQQPHAMVAIGVLAIGLANLFTCVVGFVSVPLSARLHPASFRRSFDSRNSVTTPSVQEPGHLQRPSRIRVSPAGGKHAVSTEQGGERDQGSSVPTKPKSRAAQECELFDWLAENSGVDKKVSLDAVQGTGRRGLVVQGDVEYGEVSLWSLSCTAQ